MAERKPAAKKAAAKKSPARKAAPRKAPVQEIDPSTLDTWSRLKYEAAQKREQDNAVPREFTPYVIEGVEPPIVIEAPTTAAQQMIIAKLIDKRGNVSPHDVHDLLAALVGDEETFERLMELLMVERADEYLVGELIREIREHFNAQVGTGSDTVPGKSRT